MDLIDIIIPIYGQASLLRSCVETVLATTSRHRIFLVDDHSPGGEIQALFQEWANHPRLVCVRTPANQGFIGATRYGADLGSSPWILFLNSDTEAFEPGWLEKLLPASADVAVTGARLLYPPDMPGPLANTIQHAGVARNPKGIPYHPFLGLGASLPQANQPRDVNAVTGACFLVRRSVWEQLGGWDARFGRGVYEDVDFCWRVKAAGLRVFYQPEACLYHRESASSDPDGSHRLNAHQQENLGKLLAKWNHPASDEAIFFGAERVQHWQQARTEMAKANQSMEKKDIQQALVFARQALETVADLQEACLLYAELLSKNHQHSEAAQLLEQAVPLAPGHWDARLHFVDELTASRQYTRAHRELLILQPVFPHHPAIRSRLERLLPYINDGRTQAQILLEELLNAEDIASALETRQGEISEELYQLVSENQRMAQTAQDLDLAEGLHDLSVILRDILDARSLR